MARAPARPLLAALCATNAGAIKNRGPGLPPAPTQQRYVADPDAELLGYEVPECRATRPLDVSGVDVAGLTDVRVEGLTATVKYTTLPRGSAPRVSVTTNAAGGRTPAVAVDGGVLIVRAANCSGGAARPALSAASSLRPSGWWVGVVPLLFAPHGARPAAAALLAAGYCTAAAAEPTCDDAVEVEIALPAGEGADLSSPAARAEALRALRRASVPRAPNDDPRTGGAGFYTVDPSDYRLYANGEHRRPTDPATSEEISAAQRLLFGDEGSVTTLARADALAADPNGWAAAAAVLARVGGVDPAAVGDVNRIPAEAGDPSGGEARAAFLAKARADGFPAAHAWLRRQAPLRRALTWWGVNQIAAATPCRAHVIAVEGAIERGETRYEMRRLILVRMSGGATAYTDGGTKLWGAELHVAVDVSDPRRPFVDPSRVEIYTTKVEDHKMLGGAGGRLSDLHTANHPGGGEGRAQLGGSVQLPDLDKYYLKAAAMAVYGDDQYGHPRALDVQIQGDTAIKRWAKPFEWLDGAAARSYGETADEFLFWANMHELSPSTVPFDGHSESGGVFMFPLPITMVYAAALDGRLTGADPRNTLAGSQAGALCFYGRGLTFPDEDAAAFSRALHPSRLTPTQFPLNVSRSDLAAIRVVVSRAIARAWGDDEASPGSGFRPGRLARREGDGATVPAVAAKHSYNVATYVNHATSAALEGKLLGGMTHRDARDNVDHMAPPEDPDGKPLFHPNGKPRSVVEPSGRNFEIDGYAVTYKVGVTWKFMLGFDADAGLTMYHLRVVLPPSRAHPKGREVPYLYRAFIPNFGTDYSATNLGNPSSFLFKESHFGDATGLHKPSICGGATLPVFRSKHGAYLGKAANATQYYSTYGLGIPDPYSEMLGHHAPMQAFPNQKVDNGLIPQAFCIQELDLGHNMWHMYTAQHLRALQVSQSTISDAYNVVVNFKMKSDGKFSVGEILHGKPGVGTHAIPGVGGQYASGGKGGLATNHMHWHVIALEPHLRMDTKGVVNRLHVSDLVAPADEPADWFGTAFHRRTTTVTDASETDLLKYDFSKQRYWRIAAVNESSGEDMGSLKLTSAHFSPPILPGNRPAKNVAPEDTYAGNHWWLTQDVHVVNATVRRDSTVLNARGTEPGYDPAHAVGHPLRAHPKYDRPMVFCTIKVHHEVVEEEMPAQSAFANIDVDVQPHNLYGFNPNILVRYQPEYNDWYENTWMKSYTPPYTSEFDEGH